MPKDRFPKPAAGLWLLISAAWVTGIIALLATCSQKPSPPLPAEPEQPGGSDAAKEAEARGERLRQSSRTANARSAELLASSRALRAELAALDAQRRAVWAGGAIDARGG